VMVQKASSHNCFI